MSKPIQMGVRGRSPRETPIPALALRVIGICLLLGALLPWAATLRRARLLPPPPGQTLHLRPELMVLPANRGDQPPRRPFAITTARITEEQFRAVLGLPQPPEADPDRPALAGPPGDMQRTAPMQYCDQLSALEGWPRCYQAGTLLAGCTGYRLPSKDELIYAARADLPEVSKEWPNRWRLSDLDQRNNLIRDDLLWLSRGDDGTAANSGGARDRLLQSEALRLLAAAQAPLSAGFVVVRTCPDLPQPCGHPQAALGVRRSPAAHHPAAP